MSEEEGTDLHLTCFFQFLFVILFFLFLTGQVVIGVTLERDKEVLLELKAFLQIKNHVNQGVYVQWTESDPSPCNWTGITCENGRVTRINLVECTISGELYSNFSHLTELTHLDLSKNTIGGFLPADLNQCRNLKYLNLSHNILDGELSLPGLTRLEVLDVTLNRFVGGIQSNFPEICTNLVTLNISMNNFTGEVGNSFDECLKLKYLDLSTNNFTGSIWPRISGMWEFSASENNLTGTVSAELFQTTCELGLFDVSQNKLFGQFPGSIANCKNLTNLNLSMNNFTGGIPRSIGTLLQLEALFLGRNNFDRNVPEELLRILNLTFLDLSKNNFTGDIQPIFGKFTQVKFLLLHGNCYTGGIESSGILKLPKVERLDLSYNNFTGPLPVGVVPMPRLKYLILAYNNFSGQIPPKYGHMAKLQALDLSYNQLTGPIPSSIGNLTSLLWLMLANNYLTGEIPPDIGNCSSLLWLNLANNQLTGTIPPSISEIGRDPNPTFQTNRRDDRVTAGSGECLSMKRWIPANYPPFSFAYNIMTRKICRSTWDHLLKGNGIVPICTNSSSSYKTLAISGYIQLAGNRLSGEIPPEIGQLGNFSLIHLNHNQLSGRLPAEIALPPLVVLNVSQNHLSGAIPSDIGYIKCLQNLDLSYNNFSGQFPATFNRLSELNKFNVSYNPLLTGEIPDTGQMATFDEDSFIGDPLIDLAAMRNRSAPKLGEGQRKPNMSRRMVAFYVFLGLSAAFFALGVLAITVCLCTRLPAMETNNLLLSEDGSKSPAKSNASPSISSTTASTSSSAVKVFRLDKTAFTYSDIVTATGNFSENAVIGRGGFGTVYRGVLPDGRLVAVKKLQREGSEGEREFRAEMEVLSGGSSVSGGWPHPNLVALFGWCLSGSEKLLVYEYMEGGSLEDIITNWAKLGWARRVGVAVGVARALVFLHHECYPAVVHRDVKASNVLLDGEGKARVTDFGLARVVAPEETHVSTMVAGTVGYVAPEYGQTWQATTKGDVYSFGVLVMELATGRRAVEGGEEECLVEWVRRVGSEGWQQGLKRVAKVVPVAAVEGKEEEEEGLMEMFELLRIGVRCTADAPQARPNMKEVLAMLIKIGPYHKGLCDMIIG